MKCQTCKHEFATGASCPRCGAPVGMDAPEPTELTIRRSDLPAQNPPAPAPVPTASEPVAAEQFHDPLGRQIPQPVASFPELPSGDQFAASFCINCGDELRPGLRFCTACGAPAGPIDSGDQATVLQPVGAVMPPIPPIPPQPAPPSLPQAVPSQSYATGFAGQGFPPALQPSALPPANKGKWRALGITILVVYALRWLFFSLLNWFSVYWYIDFYESSSSIVRILVQYGVLVLAAVVVTLIASASGARKGLSLVWVVAWVGFRVALAFGLLDVVYRLGSVAAMIIFAAVPAALGLGWWLTLRGRAGKAYVTIAIAGIVLGVTEYLRYQGIYWLYEDYAGSWSSLAVNGANTAIGIAVFVGCAALAAAMSRTPVPPQLYSTPGAFWQNGAIR